LEDAGRRLLAELGQARQRLLEEARRPFRYIYLIWQNPYMAAGPGTFIDAFVREAGGENVLGSDRGRELDVSRIEELGPDAVLFSSEPFPFEEQHVAEFLESCRDKAAFEGRALLVDGELLSWHGVRLREGIPYLSQLARQIVAIKNRPR
jgi:ABC-type Fe3+-hydroxamate transport system substrate-binding protein